MKKIVFLFCLAISSVFGFADVVKVAILEPVDRDGSVAYAHKLMLRSNLAKAIANTPGYEAYDRADMDAIMSEQNFQRTGMVSDDQIKRLGEMTGASFILVSEAVKVDDSNMFITAKILNVETARVDRTDNVLMGASAADIQNGCISLAQKLLGISVPATPAATQKSTPKTTVTTTKNQSATYAAPVVAAPAVQSAPVGGQAGIGALRTFEDGSRGIVFYITADGHGLAVSMQETKAKWDVSRGRDVQDVYELPNINSAAPYITRIGEGADYTAAILRQIPAHICAAAAWCTSQGQGWYLPSASELMYLFKVANEGKSKKGPISQALVNYGGKALSGGWYWTSSEVARDEVINISDGGSKATEEKDEENSVRAIRAF